MRPASQNPSQLSFSDELHSIEAMDLEIATAHMSLF